MVTRLQQHCNRWSSCQRCELSTQRSQVVIGRGTVPCDVLFIGEAPGLSEDALGLPFVGPAGKLLDGIIKDSLPEGMTFALTNIVACFPKEAKETEDHAPPAEAIKSCSPRLKEFISLCSPRMVVCVGAVSAKNVAQQRNQLGLGNVHFVSITHPAAILRNNVTMRELLVRKCIVQISTAIDKL